MTGMPDRAKPSLWTRHHVTALQNDALPSAPLIAAHDAVPLLPDLDLWDIWPLQSTDGRVADIAGGSLWMILSAPRLPDPDMRHDVARTRLLHKTGNEWRDCGNLFPEGLNPAEREWSGSAVFEGSRVTAYFTGAGRKGTEQPSFEQRLFQSEGVLDLTGAMPRIVDWSTPVQSVVNDGRYYIDVRAHPGIPGLINGFRDPCWFDDPANGRRALLFTGSLAGAEKAYSGVIGLALADTDGFVLQPPIVSAQGIANELERPHMIVRDGRYYLFWSTQGNMFSPDLPKMPTGLYGMVGESLSGPYVPLNGSGLVIANPVEEPKQAYCWQVLDTLEVVSFVDHWGLSGRNIRADAALNRAQFGGTIAPMLKIEIEGNTTRLVGLA